MFETIGVKGMPNLWPFTSVYNLPQYDSEGMRNDLALI